VKEAKQQCYTLKEARHKLCMRAVELVILLCETWHDVDSVAIRRLRADGFRVVERDRPRPHRTEATLSVNHGGVAIAAVAGVRMTKLDIGFQPSSSRVLWRVVLHRRRHLPPSGLICGDHHLLRGACGCLGSFVDLRRSTCARWDVNLRLDRICLHLCHIAGAERRCYFDLVGRKRAMFWTIHVDAEGTQPRRLWRSFDQLLGRGRNLRSTRQLYISFSTTRLPASMPPRQALSSLSSLLRPSAASSVCSLRSRRLR